MTTTNKLHGFYVLLTIFVIAIGNINTSLAETSVLNETSQTITNGSYFMYSYTATSNTKFSVELTSNVQVDFFILDYSNGVIYQDLFGVVDKGKTFNDIDFLFDSYSENVTTRSFSFKATKTIDIKFTIDNSNLAGAFADSDAIISVKISSTSGLPSLGLPLAFFALTLCVLVIKVIRR